jgi:integrase
VKTLRPREKPYRLADGSGLSIEVNPGGAKTWVFRYRLNGRQVPVRLGRYPVVSLAEAREKRFEAARMVSRGKSPALEKKAARAGVSDQSTVTQFATLFLDDVVRRSRKQTVQVERYIRNQICPEIGNRKISEVTPHDVLRMVDKIKGRGSPMAALAVRNLLKRIFEYAMARQLVTFNPAAAIPAKAIASPKARERSLTSAEIQIYLTKLYASDVARRYKLALHLILITLVRKSELTLAEWKDVNLEAKEWHIPAPNSKAGKPRVVYLPEQAVEMFEELRELAGESKLILPGRNKPNQPISGSILNLALESIKFGIPPFTIHDSRRTASTHLHEMGWRADVIEKALGHEIRGVRGIYNRAEYATERRRMLQQWATYVEGLLGQSTVVGIRVARA